jgi:hypothetical protein
MKRLDSTERRIKEIASVLHRVSRARNGVVTLQTNTSVTTVAEPTALTDSHVIVTPQTSNAASALGFLWISPSRGSIDFNHHAMTLTDCTFTWSISVSGE